MGKFFCLAPLLLLLFVEAPKAQYRFEKPLVYNEESGLPKGAKVLDIAQDQNGFIWLGSTKGLARLDGSQLSLMLAEDSIPDQLLHNYIVDLFFDASQNELYIGTYGGLSVLNTATLQFQNYVKGEGANNLPFDEVVAIFRGQTPSHLAGRKPRRARAFRSGIEKNSTHRNR